MPQPQRVQRAKTKTLILRLSALSLLWVAVSAILVLWAGQGWKALAVVSLPILGFFVTALVALRFGPFPREDHDAPSAEDPPAPTA